LLYTAGGPTRTEPEAAPQPIAYLTYPVWTYYQQANNGLHYLAYDAALLLIVLILILLVGSRFVVARTRSTPRARSAEQPEGAQCDHGLD